MRRRAALVVLALAVAVTPALAAKRPTTPRLLSSAPALSLLPAWRAEPTLRPTGNPSSVRFGAATAPDSQTLAIGAPFDDTVSGVGSGAV